MVNNCSTNPMGPENVNVFGEAIDKPAECIHIELTGPDPVDPTVVLEPQPTCFDPIGHYGEFCRFDTTSDTLQ